MPELPDIEALRLYLLDQGILGRSLSGVTVLWHRAVRRPSSEAFVERATGCRIDGLRRRAKYLVFKLHRASGEPDLSMIVHLGMTGALVFRPSDLEPPRYTWTIFHLDGPRDLCFPDPRKLGKLWLVEDENEIFAGLGPEPLDTAFTTEELGRRLAGRTAPVKALFCDQSVVAGIGNIYADEVLFAAGIHPLTRGGDISERDVERLHRAIAELLPAATVRLSGLIKNGTPPTESERGLEGLVVPRSEGEPCSACGTPVERVTIRGRSSYFCPRQQGWP